MGKDAIIAKIGAEAEEKSAAVISAAEQKANEITAKATAEAEEFVEKVSSEADAEAAKRIEQRKTLSELDGRKIILKAKRDVINDAFIVALDKLRSVSKTYYLRLVERSIAENAETGDVIVLSKDGVLSEKDVEAMPCFKNFNLSVAKERGDFNGGVKLVGKNCDKDLSFAAIIEGVKEEKTAGVASVLF